MLFRLAWASLTRHRARTVLAILGVAVSAAMLLDMVMLSSGMRSSFKSLLLARGFQLRVAPKGTLPLDTDATIAAAAEIAALLRAMPDVAAVSPVLGGQLHVPRDSTTVTATALGGDAAVQGDYEITSGREPRAPDELVASDDFLRAANLRVGDTVTAAAGYDPQLRTFSGGRQLRVVGRAHFLYMAAEQRAVALPLETLQAMQGEAARDRVSFFMVRARQGANVDSVLHRIERDVPRVSAISTESAIRQIDERLSYFRQLAFILGTVSLAVGFLLVTTLVTVSVNERLGEIVVMRAIGVARGRVVSQIVLGRNRDHARRRGRGTWPWPCDGAVSRLDPRIVSRAAGFDRLLPLRATRRMVGAGHARGRRHSRRHLSVVARRVGADRDDVARRGRGMSGEPVVLTRDVRRDYHMGDEIVHAVRGVSLEIARGDLVAIVGPSGCGKSTLLNLIGGIDRPTAGSVVVDGNRVDAMRDAAATRFRLLSIGFVFQRFYLMPALSAVENVELPMAEAGLSAARRTERARELLAYVGLAERRRHRPAQLSGGEQQRVAIARALANSPKLLLADEPTGELDAKTGAEMIDLLGRVNRDGTTVVVVTHDEDLARAAKRVVHMRDGVVVDDHRQNGA